MKKWSQRASALGLVASSALAVACSGDARLPSGEHFSEAATGMPGVVLIDDMEDGTQYIISDNGLQGLWYTYNDESAGGVHEPSLGFPMYRTRTPSGEPDPASQVAARPCGDPGNAPFFAGETECTFVARTWGDGQSGWGAGMGVDLNGEAGEKNPIDASAYAGIGFFIRGSARNNAVRVNVQDVRTTPESAGAADLRRLARCESFYLDDAGEVTASGPCNDHYGRPVAVTDEWTWVELPFNCLNNGGWGFGGLPPNADFRPDLVVGVQFQITGADPADTGSLPPGATLMPFDFAIDNLSFLERSRVEQTGGLCPPLPTP